jgi:hypothetical protein
MSTRKVLIIDGKEDVREALILQSENAGFEDKMNFALDILVNFIVFSLGIFFITGLMFNL